jgi:hypothetical protein
VVGAIVVVLVRVLGGEDSNTAMSTTDGERDTMTTGGVENVSSSLKGEADGAASVTVGNGITPLAGDKVAFATEGAALLMLGALLEVPVLLGTGTVDGEPSVTSTVGAALALVDGDIEELAEGACVSPSTGAAAELGAIESTATSTITTATTAVGATVSVTSCRMLGPLLVLVILRLLLGNKDNDDDDDEEDEDGAADDGVITDGDGRTLDTVTGTSDSSTVVGMKVVLGAAVAKVVTVGVNVVVIGVGAFVIVLGLPDEDGCNKEGSDNELDGNAEGAIVLDLIIAIVGVNVTVDGDEDGTNVRMGILLDGLLLEVGPLDGRPDGRMREGLLDGRLEGLLDGRLEAGRDGRDDGTLLLLLLGSSVIAIAIVGAMVSSRTSSIGFEDGVGVGILMDGDGVGSTSPSSP